MITNIYTVTGTTFKGSIVFKYDASGTLVAYELDGELNGQQIDWLFTDKFPLKETGIRMFQAIKNFTVQRGELDLSFDAFWNAYGYKVGKKPMAENIWKRMNKADKMGAMAGIKPYNSYLVRHIQQEKAHATTYLNQRYWEQDWGRH